MSLTDAEVRSLKPNPAKAYRRFDGGGLYVEVTPTGSRLWHFKFRFGGKEKRIAIGPYPRVKLGEARKARDRYRILLEDGVDPLLARKREKAARSLASTNTFLAVAQQYIRKREREGLAPATVGKLRYFLTFLEPAIGSLAIGDIDPQLLLLPLKRLEARGLNETATKTRSFASRVFLYAVANGLTAQNPAALLTGSLTAPRPKHRAAILDHTRLNEFLKAADEYSSPITRLALKILPHVFVRPGELRFATWDEIDFEKAEWTIPAERTKMRRPHRVPLSGTVIALFREAHQLTGPMGYIFHASHTRRRPMSENTLNAALRRMGFTKDEATAHGFRSTASTFLNESGLFSADAIERSLAHAPLSAVRAAYHRGPHWDERVRMAEWWSGFLLDLVSDRGRRAA